MLLYIGAFCALCCIKIYNFSSNIAIYRGASFSGQKPSGGDNIQIDIIKAAEILGACSVILGAVIGAFRLYDGMTDRLSEFERRIGELEKENEQIKKEDALVIYALRACLDGLHQKGCNGRVTEAIEMIDKHINKAAHDQK